MRSEKFENKTTYRTLLRGVSWFTSLFALAILLTACGGGNGGNQPPPPSAASLSGVVTFTDQVPLTQPPGDAFDGPVPPDVRYGARIIDPGDDIGNTPVPKPSTLTASGNYEFTNLVTDPMSYFNLRFTVDAPLEQNGFSQTPVGFNIPVALLQGIKSLLSVNIHRPSDSTLQMTYTWRGPDGSRTVRVRVDFVSDLITFDLDSDGLYDDLIGVDYNHDAIPDTQAPVIEAIDYNTATEVIGSVAGISANLLLMGAEQYTVWGSTNVMNQVTKDPMTLSDITVGDNVKIRFVPNGTARLATSVEIQPEPTGPAGSKVVRLGLIEEISANDIVVGGILFHDFPTASIKDVLGNKVPASSLEVGDFVQITGERVENYITAKEIILQNADNPTIYVERNGVIQSLSPPDYPTLMTVADLTFQLSGLTVIRDLAGMNVGVDYLEVGDPVWVLGHEDEGAFYADVVELQFVISDEDLDPEIVILIDDEDALPDFEAAIEALDTEIAVRTVVIATYPPTVSDPPCVEDAFLGMSSQSASVLKTLPGYRGNFPRVDENVECVVLIRVDEVDEDKLPYYVLFYPDGINGIPFEYDLIAEETKHGAPDVMLEAEDIADLLRDQFSDHNNLVEIYISPDIGFTDGQ